MIELTVPLLLLIAVILCIIPIGAYHAKVKGSMKTDMLKGWLVGVWCAVAVVAVIISL